MVNQYPRGDLSWLKLALAEPWASAFQQTESMKEAKNTNPGYKYFTDKQVYIAG